MLSNGTVIAEGNIKDDDTTNFRHLGNKLAERSLVL